MADWILVACLVRLRAEFNLIAPERDRASDGSKGDDAHEARVSDHNPDETGKVPIRDADKLNEVHAIDVDDDLRVPGLTMEMVVQFLLARCRSGAETRLRYIIFNRRIWQASNGWRQEAYFGDNQHTEHAHFSASYDTAKEASTASWHLEEIPVALTAQDKEWIEGVVAKAATAAVKSLITPTKLLGPDKKPDGTERTDLGHWVFNQGLPSPFEPDGGRVPAYVLLGQLGSAVKALQEEAEDA